MSSSAPRSRMIGSPRLFFRPTLKWLTSPVTGSLNDASARRNGLKPPGVSIKISVRSPPPICVSPFAFCSSMIPRITVLCGAFGSVFAPGLAYGSPFNFVLFCHRCVPVPLLGALCLRPFQESPPLLSTFHNHIRFRSPQNQQLDFDLSTV